MIVNRVEAAFYENVTARLDVLTTLGQGGVTYKGQNHPAPKVKAVSTHGAGDMFIGALAARALSGDSMESAIEAAQQVAAWHVSTPPSIRSRTDALRTFLATQDRW